MVALAKYLIEGEAKLKGSVKISGSKNSGLAVLAACVMIPGICKIKNLPDVKDINTFLKLIQKFGVKINRAEDFLEIDATEINNYHAAYDLVKTMRASIYTLGALLGRMKKAKVSFPGGCAIGPRPIDLHLNALHKLGADINIIRGEVIAEANELKGTEIFFEKSSVGATVNTIMAAVKSKGRTVLKNAAMEPEIGVLCDFLTKAGARISGKNMDAIIIEGVEELNPVEFEIPSDRIEAGTFILAAVISKSEITVENVIIDNLTALLEKLDEIGVKFQLGNKTIKVIPAREYTPVEIETNPYPGFPTDLQPMIMALLCTVKGISVIKENIFENRFTQVGELQRMGANIQVDKNIAIIHGVEKLYGCPVMASDLRAGAALVLAGIFAEGKTLIDRVYHIERGYENFVGKLQNLGLNISRIIAQGVLC